MVVDRHEERSGIEELISQNSQYSTVWALVPQFKKASSAEFVGESDEIGYVRSLGGKYRCLWYVVPFQEIPANHRVQINGRLRCPHPFNAPIESSSAARSNRQLTSESARKKNAPGSIARTRGVTRYNRLTIRSARPFSPSTTFSLPSLAMLSRTSSSRSRINVGLSDSSLAVLA